MFDCNCQLVFYIFHGAHKRRMETRFPKTVASKSIVIRSGSIDSVGSCSVPVQLRYNYVSVGGRQDFISRLHGGLVTRRSRARQPLSINCAAFTFVPGEWFCLTFPMSVASLDLLGVCSHLHLHHRSRYARQLHFAYAYFPASVTCLQVARLI